MPDGRPVDPSAVTAVPQRAQNSSDPGRTGPPQLGQDAIADTGANPVFFPHLEQNGSEASIDAEQCGHFATDGVGAMDTRVDGTADATPPPARAGAAADEAADDGFGGTTAAGTTRAADGFVGFPQSMQKRDSASFIRPQKAHEITRKPPCGMTRDGRI